MFPSLRDSSREADEDYLPHSHSADVVPHPKRPRKSDEESLPAASKKKHSDGLENPLSYSSMICIFF